MRSLCLSRWNSELQCAAVAYSRWHHLGFKLGLNLGGAKRKRGTCKAQATHGARGPCAPGVDRRRLCGPRGARVGVHWQVAGQNSQVSCWRSAGAAVLDGTRTMARARPGPGQGHARAPPPAPPAGAATLLTGPARPGGHTRRAPRRPGAPLGPQSGPSQQPPV